MSERWMIYGATGSPGQLLASRSLARGLSPLLAGRDEARLRRLAEPLGFAHRAARLDDAAALARLLRSEEHTSELQSHVNIVCRLLLEKKKTKPHPHKQD